jgi:hypothetical protein
MSAKIHINYTVILYFLVYKLTSTHVEETQFSPQMVLVVLRILNSVFWIFVLCLWSDKSSLWLFQWF